MSKIDETEYISIEIDGRNVIYNLRIQSYQRNTMLMATVSYGGKSKGLSLTLPISDNTAFESFRIMSKSVFKELYKDSNKDLNF